MSPLRQRFIDDLRLRNYAPRTVDAYVAAVARLAAHFRRSPDRLGNEDLRAFQLHLIHHDKLAWSSVNQVVCALRFFFTVTLGRAEVVEHLPYGRRPTRLPTILSREEVARFLAAVRNPRHRLMLRLAYGCGLRVSEITHLQAGDIDSARMLIHVRQSKGRKDRLVPLPARLLAELREHWRRWRPTSWLFPGQDPTRPMEASSLQRTCQKTYPLCGLTKPVTPHTLRHCYATHLLEAGLDVVTLKELLGHSDLRTTAGYTHVARKMQQTLSPLDSLSEFSALLSPGPAATPSAAPPNWLEPSPSIPPASQDRPSQDRPSQDRRPADNESPAS